MLVHLPIPVEAKLTAGTCSLMQMEMMQDTTLSICICNAHEMFMLACNSVGGPSASFISLLLRVCT